MKFFALILNLLLFHTSYSQIRSVEKKKTCYVHNLLTQPRSFTQKTASTVWQYDTMQKQILRNENDRTYRLIDSSFIFVYTLHKQFGISSKFGPIRSGATHPYFSMDGCGRIYELNSSNLKKAYRDKPDFIKRLRKRNIWRDLWWQSKKYPSITVVNELFVGDSMKSH